MLIYIRPFHVKIMEINVNPEDTIAQFKTAIQESMCGIAENCQCLIYNYKRLDNNRKTLNDYNIKEGDVIDVTLNFRCISPAIQDDWEDDWFDE